MNQDIEKNENSPAVETDVQGSFVDPRDATIKKLEADLREVERIFAMYGAALALASFDGKEAAAGMLEKFHQAAQAFMIRRFKP